MTIQKISSLLKAVLVLTTVIASFNNSQAQTNNFKEVLLKDKWVTNSILGLDTNITTYTLTKSNQSLQFGYITRFLDSLHFVSYYSAKCGNDYFTDVNGEYKFIDKNKIAISVSKVSYSGEWKKPTEYRKTNYVIFTLTMSGNTISLTKEK